MTEPTTDQIEQFKKTASEVFEHAVETMRTDPTDISKAQSALEMIGWNIAHDIGNVVTTQVDDDTKAVLAGLMAELDLSELDDACVRILREAPRCLTLDPEMLIKEVGSLLVALETRDLVEFMWLGAEYLGLVGSFSDEAVAARRSFDESVAPELWQLVPLANLRTKAAAEMKPSLVMRFWWRSRGAEFDRNSFNDPAQTDALLRVFPEARELVTAPKASQNA